MSDTSCHVQLDHDCCKRLGLFPVSNLEDGKVYRFHNGTRLVGYPRVLYQLALKRAHDNHWSQYGSRNPAVLDFDFKKRCVFDILLLRTK